MTCSAARPLHQIGCLPEGTLRRSQRPVSKRVAARYPQSRRRQVSVCGKGEADWLIESGECSALEDLGYMAWC